MLYNKFIDHTLLKQDATQKQIKKLCEEAMDYEFASVCVNPGFVKFCAKKLKESPVKVCTVIGFPLGATDTKTKVYEAKQAVKNGADEIDMVINVSKLKDKKYDYIAKEISSIKKAIGDHTLKVIIETCLLTDAEKVKACLLSKENGADFVKTSTGFSTGGATAEDVRLMRETVGKEMGVKASGGIRSHEDLVKMIEAGANRIGASCGTKICE